MADDEFSARYCQVDVNAVWAALSVGKRMFNRYATT
jgi:hypothetical protein